MKDIGREGEEVEGEEIEGEKRGNVAVPIWRTSVWITLFKRVA